MTEHAKVKLDLYNGIIEIEGPESFVVKYLEEYKTLFGQKTVKAVKLRNQKKISIVNEPKEPKNTKKQKTTPKVEMQKFDIEAGDNVKSLKDFLDEKKPGKSAANTILVIGYYITNLKGNDVFREGNIDYAYKALGLKGRPTHLRQIIINLKNERTWFEEGSEKGTWKLDRAGEIFVEESLPLKDESKAQ